jgi:hypothetical protein
MVWSKEQGAWEGRALRNDPVGHFSEGARLQGRIGAWSMEHGAWSMEQGAKRKEQGAWGIGPVGGHAGQGAGSMSGLMRLFPHSDRY